MKIAVVCAAGIGDALLFHIASHHLQKRGWEVVTFSDHLAGFGRWLSGYFFSPQPRLEEIQTTFQSFDAIFLQHDNSAKAKTICTLSLPLYIFYGSHLPSKHGPLRGIYDFVCNPNQSMVDNVVSSMKQLFGESVHRDNGLTPPPKLSYRREKRRVAIHPTSSDPEKNWPKEKFLKIFHHLQREGYKPVFTVAPRERDEWEDAPFFATLEELASFLYESGAFIGNDSGLGHLASYLNIPHLIIGPSEAQMRLWGPGWHQGAYLYPPKWVTQRKWLRKKWKSFITEKHAIKTLENSVLKN